MKTPAIAISGKAASGKSTLALDVCLELERRGFRPQRFSFGDAMRQEVRAAHGELRGEELRKALIDLAEEKVRIDPMWWVRRVAAKVWEAQREGRVPVFDDVRRREEHRWLFQQGYYLVRVNTPASVRAVRLRDRDEDPLLATWSGRSECDLDEAVFDYTTIGVEEHHSRSDAREIVTNAIAMAEKAA